MNVINHRESDTVPQGHRIWKVLERTQDVRGRNDDGADRSKRCGCTGSDS